MVMGRNMGRNITIHLNTIYRKKFLDHAKWSSIDAFESD